MKASGFAPRARIAIDLRRGRGKVVYVDPQFRVSFSAAKVASLRFAGKTATLAGTGALNGKPVRYRVAVTDNGAGRRDVIRIDLSSGFHRSARLIYGNIVVR